MTVDKRTIVLAVAAVVAVAAAVTATAVKHRSTGSRERKDVSAYIGTVNAIENRMHAPLTRVLLAYRAFAQKRGPAKNAGTQLAAAERTLTRLERRLAATPAPPEARKLRRLLLELVSRQKAITREVEGMAVFSPKFAVMLRRARAASGALGKALAAVKAPTPHRLRGTKKQVLAAQQTFQRESQVAAGAQADAVDTYDRTVVSVLAQLRTLDPPPAFAAGYRTQMRALTDVVAAGSRLSGELRTANRADVGKLGRRFTLASREVQSLSAQRAQVAAIRAYNRRAREVGAAAEKVQAELLRLQRVLP